MSAKARLWRNSRVRCETTTRNACSPRHDDYLNKAHIQNCRVEQQESLRDMHSRPWNEGLAAIQSSAIVSSATSDWMPGRHWQSVIAVLNCETGVVWTEASLEGSAMTSGKHIKRSSGGEMS